MGSIERRLAKLEAGRPKNGFTLVDGSRYVYDPDTVWKELFIPTVDETINCDYEGRPRPAPPALLQALARAKDRRHAIAQIYPEWRYRPPMCGYDLEALVESGVFVAVPLVKGYPVIEAPPEPAPPEAP